jgi:beta-lactamase regulating signal transducer with metallopeptidase domain
VSIPSPYFASAAPPISTSNDVTDATQAPLDATAQVAPDPTASAYPGAWVIEVDPSLIEKEETPGTTYSGSAPLFSLRDALLIAWLTGSLIFLTWVTHHIVSFNRLVRRGSAASPELQATVRRLANDLGLRSVPRVTLVPGAVSPMIWAVGRAPLLVFPSRLLDRLDRRQRDALILHELAHVARRDHWVRVLELVTTALFWWHPVVWWARREIHETEEQCCDAWVVWATGGENRTYAMALVQTLEFCSQARAALPVAASGIGPVPHLRRRLTMIMKGKTPRSMSWAGACAVLGLGLLLPLAPVQAGPRVDDAEEAAPQDSRDQQIEVLRKAIRALEEKRDADKPSDAKRPKADPADIKKARKDIERIENEVRQKRNDLREAEHRLQEARNRLDLTEGRTPRSSNVSVTPRIAVVPGGADVEARVISGLPGGKGDDPRVIRLDPTGKGGDGVQVIRVQPDGSGEKRIRTHIVEPGVASGKMDLESRLERLIKEVEEIRREMRRQPPRTDTRPDPIGPVPPTPGRPVSPRLRVDSTPPAEVPAIPHTPAVTPVKPIPPVPPKPPTNLDPEPTDTLPPVTPPAELPPPPPPPPPPTNDDPEK